MTDNKMLHMKLNSAVCFAALLAFLPASACMFVSPAQAGVCFLPDCDLTGTPPVICIDCKWCEDRGYYFNCPDGTAPDYSQTCSRDETYTKCTKDQYCKNKGYTKSAQSCYDLGPTWYPKDKCPNGSDLYKSCIENRQQACTDNGYVNNCPRPNKNELCPWDSSYAKCCNTSESAGCPTNSKVTGCESGAIAGKDSCGYDCRQCCVQSCPAGYAYTDEQTSGGTTGYIKDGADYCNHCTKGKLYKRKENPCTGYDVCSAYGGVDNGDYCYTGNLKKYSKCLTECRTGYVEWCKTPVTDCDKLGYKYDKSACEGQPSVACPFNKDKWYCEICEHIVTEESCTKACKEVVSDFCARNGVVYYKSCGVSKCSDGKVCSNGKCVTPSRDYSFSCCGGSGFTCGGTAPSSCAHCLSFYGVQSCPTEFERCKSQGGTPRYNTNAYSDQGCKYGVGNTDVGSTHCADQFFVCEF